VALVTPRATVPEIALAKIRRYCEDKTPVEHRDEFRVEHSVRGKSITIYECRPPWRPELGPEWTRQPKAQLRYDPTDPHWTLYCADRNSRWHLYDLAEPTVDLDTLLAEIDDDPTGIFWG
jgi:hypothetical protein